MDADEHGFEIDKSAKAGLVRTSKPGHSDVCGNAGGGVACSQCKPRAGPDRHLSLRQNLARDILTFLRM
jgi:hypothetical protein